MGKKKSTVVGGKKHESSRRHPNLGVLDFNKKNRPFKRIHIYTIPFQDLCFAFCFSEKVNKVKLVCLKMESFEQCETLGFSLHQCRSTSG